MTIARLLSREAGPAAQFLKYAVVGGIATATHVAVFFFCGWFLLPCLTQDDIAVRLLGLTVAAIPEAIRARNAVCCNVIAFLFSNSVCYLLNRLFVFVPGRHHWVVECLLFFAVSGASMVLGTTIMTYLIATHGVQTTLAFGANIGSSLLINYAMRRFVVFKG